MPFVTTLTLQSGDRRALDTVVEDIKETAERKGAELKGPHPKPPSNFRVPQDRRAGGRTHDGAPGESFDPWAYTVYTRTIEIVGHDEFARSVAQRAFPDGIHIEADVEQVRTAGYS